MAVALPAHPGAVVAPLAHEGVDQEGVDLPPGGRTEDIGHFLLPADRDDVRVQQVHLQAGAFEEPAAQGERPAHSRHGRIEGTRLDPFNGDVLLDEEGLQFLEGDDFIHHGWTGGVPGLQLLGDTGADEDAPDLFGVHFPDGDGRRDHRRDDGDEPRDEVRLVFPDELDHGGTGGGDPYPLPMFFEELPIGIAHQVGAVGDLDDGLKTGVFEGAHDPARMQVGKLRGKGGGQEGDNGLARFQELLRAFQTAGIGLGILRTDHRAIAAGDAAVRNDRCLPFHDFNRLYRAVPDAGVAAPAVLLDGLNRFKHDFFLSRVFFAGVLPHTEEHS